MKSFRLRERKRLVLLGDLVLVNIATLMALAVHASRTTFTFGFPFLASHYFWFLFFSSLWVVASIAVGAYDVKAIVDLLGSIKSVLFALVSVFLLYLSLFFFTATGGLLPRGIVIYQAVFGFILLSSWRWFFLRFAGTEFAVRKVIIVGAGWAGISIARTIHKSAGRHFQILGFVDDIKTGWVDTGWDGDSGRRETQAEDNASITKIEIIGKSTDLRQLVDQRGVSEVIIAVTHEIHADLYRAILECRELGVQISPMTQLFEYLTGRVPTEHIGENWSTALPLDAPGGGGLYLIASRAFDVVGSLLGLAIFLPLFPVIATALYLDSPGPIFYSQTRVGKGGKPFSLVKLRTMIPEAEKAGPQRAISEDPRLTRIGKFLRKVRLDEMPQLINVLKGEMSAVGPRPERPGHLQELDREIPFHRLRNAVRPGMAGWAAVNYGYIESLEDAKIRLEYDLYYVKHQSILLDLRILLRMIIQVFQMRGR